MVGGEMGGSIRLVRGRVGREGVAGTVGGAEGHEEGERDPDSRASGMEMMSWVWV